MGTDPAIKYLNTDMEVVGPADLRPIVAEFCDLGLFNLTCQEHGLSRLATFEVSTCNGPAEPENAILTLLDAVEALSSKCMALLNTCTRRSLCIGYQCGSSGGPVEHAIPPDILQRMSRLGMELRVTLYPTEQNSRLTRRKDQSAAR